MKLSNANAKNWLRCTWGDLITLEYGKGIRDYDKAPGPYRVYGSNGPIGWHSEPLTKGPGIVLGRKGAYRGVHFSTHDFYVIDTAYYVSPISSIDIRWIYYAMIHYKVGEIDDGSPIPSTTRSAVYKSKLTLPPLEDQIRISELLGCLDEKISSLQRGNQLIEQAVQAVFNDWFVNFGPTRAKMAGQASYLAPEVWALFPDGLDDDGFPLGWEQREVGEEVAIVGGTTPSTANPEFWGGDIAWATPKDLSRLQTPVLQDTERKVTEAGLAQIGSGLLPQGTVLMSSRAPIGYLAIAEVPTAINQGFIAMRCEGRLSKHFMWLWTQANMDAIKQKANGSTFQEVSKSSFRTIPVTVASAEVLAAFEAAVAPLYRKIVSNEQEIRALAATRDYLLPKLMSGEIRVGTTD